MTKEKKSNKVSKKKKIFKSPSAFSVLFVIIAIIAGLTWVIPSGSFKYRRDEKTKKDVAQSGTLRQFNKTVKVVEDKEHDQLSSDEITVDEADRMGYSTESGNQIELRQGIWDIFMSPLKGMIDKLDIIMFVLVLGGFLGVVMKTGVLDASIVGLLSVMKGREKLLIPILMTLFAIGGTTYGMQEEAVAFYPLVIPVMLAAGYNTMTAVMVIVLGGGSGVLASTVNPFSTALAAQTAGIEVSQVLLPQAVIFVLSLAMSIIFTMRYAEAVKSGKYKEDEGKGSKVKPIDFSKIPKLSLERKIILGIFASTFIIMVLSLIPWSDFGVTFFEDIHSYLISLPVVGQIIGFSHSNPFGEWYFNEISALFLISTALVKIVYYEEFKKEDVSVTNTFLAGVGDLLSVSLVIAVAAAIGSLMRAGGIQDVIVNFGGNSLKGAGPVFAGIMAFLFFIPMSFIIPSSSGLATASMPIIAPILAEIIGNSGRIVAVVAFATISGILNMIAPTIASLIAGLTISGVSYKNWVKRVAPLMFAFTILSLAAVVVLSISR